MKELLTPSFQLLGEIDLSESFSTRTRNRLAYCRAARKTIMPRPRLSSLAGARKNEAAISQSLVGRNNATKAHGLLGFIRNPYVFMTCAFASLGCMMYGYDQGVMGPILVMENFQSHFPSLTGSTIQGWLVSALELGAWFGALFNGCLSDKISRKYSMMVAVLIFTLGTGFQVGAQNPAMLFAGRVIGGIGIGEKLR